MTPEVLKVRTKKFALKVIELVGTLPRHPAAQVIGKQLLEAGTSVGANYRAACRAQSHQAFKAKLAIVEEEADESLYWLELLEESNTMPPERLRDHKREADELVAIFTASRKTAKHRSS